MRHDLFNKVIIIDSKINVIEKRTDMDLLDRSIPGLIIYALLWPLIFIPVNFHTLQPQISWGFTAGLGGLSILRYLLKLTTKSIYQSSPQKWLVIFATLSIGQAALWGGGICLNIV